jgi:hypothetical protein
MAVNAAGELRSNQGADAVNAVTWGVFPGAARARGERVKRWINVVKRRRRGRSAAGAAGDPCPCPNRRAHATPQLAAT